MDMIYIIYRVFDEKRSRRDVVMSWRGVLMKVGSILRMMKKRRCLALVLMR
jgi:hypothetical protein